MTAFASFSTSFVMTGVISGYTHGWGFGAPPLFMTQVLGSGTTSFSGFRRSEEGGRVAYSFGNSGTQLITFQDQTPAPEPATLLLCASGAAVMWTRRRRRPAKN